MAWVWVVFYLTLAPSIFDLISEWWDFISWSLNFYWLSCIAASFKNSGAGRGLLSESLVKPIAYVFFAMFASLRAWSSFASLIRFPSIFYLWTSKSSCLILGRKEQFLSISRASSSFVLGFSCYFLILFSSSFFIPLNGLTASSFAFAICIRAYFFSSFSSLSDLAAGFITGGSIALNCFGGLYCPTVLT